MFKVGIIGATGYVGVELLRLLLNHDDVIVTAISSSTFKDEEISSVYRSFLIKQLWYVKIKVKLSINVM